MANFPYKVTVTKTAQQDGSTLLNLVITDATNAVISNTTTRYAPSANGESVPVSTVVDLIKLQIRSVINANFTINDLPNNASFTFNPIDLL